MACGIDHREVRGGRQFRCRSLHGRRLVGAFPGHAVRRFGPRTRPDQPGSRVQVIGVQQALPAAQRRCRKGRVGDVVLAVGIGQASGFAVAVNEVDTRHALSVLGGGGGQALEEAENLAHHQRAGRRRRHAAEPKAPPVVAERLARESPVAGQVGQREPARVGGVAVHGRHDRLGERPFVQGTCTVPSHQRERRRVLGIAQQRAHRLGAAVVAVVKRPCEPVLAQGGVAFEQGVQPRPDGEALLGQLDRRLEQPRPGQAAVGEVSQLEHAQQSRHADRTAAHGRGLKGQRRALRAEEKRVVDRCRRGLAAVVGAHALAVPVQQEGAPADAAGLRFDQAEHHLCGHRRVERRAAFAQHARARFGSQRVGGDNRLAREALQGFWRVAAGLLGRARRLELCRRVRRSGLHRACLRRRGAAGATRQRQRQRENKTRVGAHRLALARVSAARDEWRRRGE